MGGGGLCTRAKFQGHLGGGLYIWEERYIFRMRLCLGEGFKTIKAHTPKQCNLGAFLSHCRSGQENTQQICGYKGKQMECNPQPWADLTKSRPSNHIRDLGRNRGGSHKARSPWGPKLQPQVARWRVVIKEGGGGGFCLSSVQPSVKAAKSYLTFPCANVTVLT